MVAQAWDNVDKSAADTGSTLSLEKNHLTGSVDFQPNYGDIHPNVAMQIAKDLSESGATWKNDFGDHFKQTIAPSPPKINKHTKGKIEMQLLPWEAIREVAAVMTWAISADGPGYQEDSWKTVAPKDYESALLRHYIEYKLRNKDDTLAYDKESRLLASAHLAANALFLLWKDLQEEEASLGDAWVD